MCDLGRAAFLTAFLILLGAATPGERPLQPQASPDPAPPEILGYSTDLSSRMTVPVSIGGRGPFPFIVDTGAERTVISTELARELALDPGRRATLHSVTEVSEIRTVVIPALEVGTRRVEEIHAPALPRINLGAIGILGVDGLRDQRVDFDFVEQEMIISPSRRGDRRPTQEGEIVVEARSRFGRLVLVDASLDGQRVYVIIDTGSQFSLGNQALRRRLARRNRLGILRPVEVRSVTGGSLTAQYTVAQHLRIGGIDISNLPIAFADAHVFDQLGLKDRPAMLLGMDALRLFDRVSVDFANRRVRVILPTSSSLDQDTRLAALLPQRR